MADERTRTETYREAPGTGALPDEPYYRRGAEPNRMRQLGLILILAGLIWMVFEFTTNATTFGIGWGFVERSVPIERSFTANRLVLGGVNDNVQVTTWDRDEIRIAATVYGYSWNADQARAQAEQLQLAFSQEGDTVRVERAWAPSQICFLFCRSPYVAYEVTMPRSADLEVSVVSGDVDVQGLQGITSASTVSGDIELEDLGGTIWTSTTSGDVEASDLRGQLTAESVSGGIEVEQSALSGLSANTTSGDVAVTGLEGDLRVQSISGDIEIADALPAALEVGTTSGRISLELRGLPSGQNWQVESVSGDVTLRLPGGADVRIEASTISGSLDNNTSWAEERRSARQIVIQNGAGRTSVRIETTSGDVTVDD